MSYFSNKLSELFFEKKENRTYFINYFQSINDFLIGIITLFGILLLMKENILGIPKLLGGIIGGIYFLVFSLKHCIEMVDLKYNGVKSLSIYIIQILYIILLFLLLILLGDFIFEV